MGQGSGPQMVQRRGSEHEGKALQIDFAVISRGRPVQTFRKLRTPLEIHGHRPWNTTLGLYQPRALCAVAELLLPGLRRVRACSGWGLIGRRDITALSGSPPGLGGCTTPIAHRCKAGFIKPRPLNTSHTTASYA